MKLRSNKTTTLTDVHKKKSVKVQLKDSPHSNPCTSQTSTTKFPGVCKFKDGYCARIQDPLTKKQLWLGSFKSAEEASMVYSAKKTELEEEQRIQGVVCDQELKKVVDQSGQCLGGNDKESSLQIGSRELRSSKKKEVEESHSSRRKIGGVNKSKGKYVARITHPVSKKRIWLGSFGSAEEASMACLAKNTELEKELHGNEGKGIQGDVCNEEIKKDVDQLGPCLENQESSLQIDSGKEGISKKMKKKQNSSLQNDSRKEGISKKKKKNQDSLLQNESRKEGISKKKKKNQGSSLQIDSRKEGISKNDKVVDQSGQCLVENGTGTCEENRDPSLQIDSRKEGIMKNDKVVDQSGQCLVENGTGTCEENINSSLQITSRKVRISKKNKKKKRSQVSSLQIDARKTRISKKKKICQISERMIVGFLGVSQSKSGKYVARITHPISKKKLWLGTYGSAEEASMVYLTKKAELQKEVQAKEGVEKSSHLLAPILEERIHNPCSNNQDSSMKIEPIDSFDGQSASRMENLPIQINMESAEKELYVGSESGAEILLRTESGVPLMDSHGFLLGSWSWIDDLSLPIV